MKYIKNLFNGRLNRLNFLIGFVLMVVVSVAGMEVKFLIIPIMIVIFVFSYSIQVRRWHDFNKPWIYLAGILIFLLTINVISRDLSNIANLIYGVFLVVYTGSKGKNNFGNEDKNIGLKSILGLKK